MCTCYGNTIIEPLAAPQQKESISTTHHESPRYIYGGARRRYIKKAPVINHTDQELVMLEALVGRQPPFDLDDEDSYY